MRFTAIQLGLVHHEVGHINYTDFTAKRSDDAFTRHLENLLEDIRQEMLHIACVHNGRSALDALDLAMHHTGDDPVDGPDVTPEGAFACWLCRTLRFTVRSQGYLAEGVHRARAALEQRIGPQAIEAVEALLPRVTTLANTTETIALASEIAAVLREELQQLQNQSQHASQDPEQGQDQQKGRGSGTQAASSEQDDQQEQGQSQQQAQQDDQDPQHGSDSPQADGSAQPDPDQDNGQEPPDAEGQQEQQGPAARFQLSANSKPRDKAIVASNKARIKPKATTGRTIRTSSTVKIPRRTVVDPRPHRQRRVTAPDRRAATTRNRVSASPKRRRHSSGLSNKGSLPSSMRNPSRRCCRDRKWAARETLPTRRTSCSSNSASSCGTTGRKSSPTIPRS